MLIGLLWYFNFVQIPNMGKIPDDQKPAVSKFIAPKALFWFRWAALATLLTGLILAHLNGYLHDAMLLSTYDAKNFMIGVGMWLGIIMAFNVWFRIWPAQQKIITAIKGGEAPNGDDVALAGLRSKHNTYMSVPLIWTMINQHHVTWEGMFGISGEVWLLIMVALGWHLVFQLYKKSATVKGF